MPDSEKDDVKKPTQSITLPENSNVRIQVVNPGERPKKDVSQRSVFALIGGTIGAVVGYAAAKLGLNSHLSEFENAVDIATRNQITGRGGLAAGFTEAGGFTGSNLGAGLSHGEVYRANYGELARSGKYGKLPKLMYDTFRTEGSSVIALGGAAVVGTIGAVMAYKSAPEKKDISPSALAPNADKDWTEKTEAAPQDKAPTRS